MSPNRVGCALVVLLASLIVASAVGRAQRNSQERRVQPLLLDVAGNGIATSPAAAGVQFSLDGPGRIASVAWTLQGSDDAFVAIDSDHNGLINSGLELIGGASPGPNGFSTLRTFKGIDDPSVFTGGVVSATTGRLVPGDTMFGELLLWTDQNHDGQSQEEEIESLSNAGVTGLMLGYQQVNTALPGGSSITLEGSAYLRNAKGVEMPRRLVAVDLARR